VVSTHPSWDQLWEQDRVEATATHSGRLYLEASRHVTPPINHQQSPTS